MVCEEAKLKWICIKECQANYVNTLAQKESNCTFSAGLRSWVHSVSLTRQSNLFTHFLITWMHDKKLFKTAKKKVNELSILQGQ